MGVEVGRAGQAQAHGRLPGKMARSFHTSSLCKLAQEAACGPQGRWPPGLQLILRSDWRCRASSPDFCAGLQPAGHREAPPAGDVQPSRDPPPGLCCRLCFHRWWGRPAAFASLCLWELRPPGTWPRRSSRGGPPWPKGPNCVASQGTWDDDEVQVVSAGGQGANLRAGIWGRHADTPAWRPL